MKGPENSTELNWHAFRYIADEMDSAEREAFEDQLADDQQAREAVAEVVELTQSVVLAVESSPNTESTTQPARFAPLAWMSLGAALCLAVTLTLQPANPTVPSVASNDATANSELAEHWVSSGRTAENEASEWHAPLPQDALESELVLNESTESDIPNWLLAAVSKQPSEMEEN